MMVEFKMYKMPEKQRMKDVMQIPVTIRQATLVDAQTIAEVHVRSWQWAYRNLIPNDYLDSLSATLNRRIEARRDQLAHLPPQNRWWVAEHADHIAGFAMTGPSRDSDAPPLTAEVFAIYLAPNAAGKGIGRILFEYAVEDLRQREYDQATLWVLESNARARRFYEVAGWTLDGGSKSEERPGVVLHEVRYRTVLRQTP